MGTMLWSDTHIYCKMIYCKMMTTIRLVNTCIMSHTYHFVCACLWWEHLRFTHSNFQIYNTALLAIVIILYMRCSQLNVLWLKSHHFFKPLAPGNHHSTLYFHEFDFLKASTYKLRSYSMPFSDLFHLA